jgi:hypothetical protein
MAKGLFGVNQYITWILTDLRRDAVTHMATWNADCMAPIPAGPPGCILCKKVRRYPAWVWKITILSIVIIILVYLRHRVYMECTQAAGAHWLQFRTVFFAKCVWKTKKVHL